MQIELKCHICGDVIEGWVYDLHEHMANCGYPCVGCDGFGLVEFTESAHDPSCDGTCKDCPIPVPAVEQCGRCEGTGKIDPS